MAGRRKSRKPSKGHRKGHRKGYRKGHRRARESYQGLTRKQLIARLRAAHAGRGSSKRRKGRRKARGLSFSQKVKYGMVSAIPEGYLENARGSDLHRYNDPGRRRKKGKKGKKTRKASSPWISFIRKNKNRRGMRKKNGQLNLRALGAAYRKTAAGKKSTKKSSHRAKGHRKTKRAKKRSSRRDYGWY